MSVLFDKQNPWRKNGKYKFAEYHYRMIFPELLSNLENKYILGLVGSRQVGKSSLIYMIIEDLLKNNIDPQDIYYFNLDDFGLHEIFKTADDFLFFIKPSDKRKYIFIDEIQRLENSGLFLKAIYDLKLNIKIIYSGSSQFEIQSKVKEHLVGRSRSFEIQRVNFEESQDFVGSITKNELLKSHLLYGGYPAVVLEASPKEKQLILRDIYQTYVQKDITEILKIDNVETFNKLLVMLASRIGNLLNIDDLSKGLKTSRYKVEHYLNILEQTFIIKRIYPFYQNYNKEVTKTAKIYFLDLGLRNLILKNFIDIELREDKGALFENFYLLELLSKDFYEMDSINYWRTTNQTEIDFIVRSQDGLIAIETKYTKGSANPRSFATFAQYYPEANFKLIDKSSIN